MRGLLPGVIGLLALPVGVACSAANNAPTQATVTALQQQIGASQTQIATLMLPSATATAAPATVTPTSTMPPLPTATAVPSATATPVPPPTRTPLPPPTSTPVPTVTNVPPTATPIPPPPPPPPPRPDLAAEEPFREEVFSVPAGRAYFVTYNMLAPATLEGAFTVEAGQNIDFGVMGPAGQWHWGPTRVTNQHTFNISIPQGSYSLYWSNGYSIFSNKVIRARFRSH
ncbi:MAG: hypothetical protein NTZ05_17525 [Chloroflexi bacterium]|nr:hypothetical protein [Chloroflexota bacterium]